MAEEDANAAQDAPEIAYQSLYRRYRPQRFSEVKGQDHVTLPLRNSVAAGRVAHAYLFSGPRGTGKTSTARILAKALNCATPSEGEPCGLCDSCVAIAAGSSFDVHELDAASNNGVGEMRDLVARASLYSPGRSKVYIIDEVHMLSTGASNALLKTLEEPPGHVVFVLATTDPQKLLPTIRSRTQHFEFHLLSEEVLDSLLAGVAADAHLELPEGAIDLARHRAKGSARDALSMLDQVAAAGVLDDDTDALAAIARALGESDTPAALGGLAAAIRAGRDPQQIAIELVERLRVGFLALAAPDAPPIDELLLPAVLEEAGAIGRTRCVRAMQLVGEAIVAMREAPEPRITLEVALIRLTHPEIDDSTDALLDRIERLERRIEGLGAAEGAASSPPPPVQPPARAVAPREPRGDPTPPEEGESPEGPSRPPAATPPAAPEGAPATPARAAGRPALGAYTTRTTVTEGAAQGGPTPGLPSTPPDPPVADPPAAGTAQPVDPDQPAAPTRDELVAAWGDHVLLGLRPSVKMVYAAGRFVPCEGPDAQFALPNNAHVGRAEALRGEVCAALERHFGRRISLHLVVDGSWDGGEATPPPRRTAPPSVIDPGEDPFPDHPSPTAVDPGEEESLSGVAEEVGESDRKLGLTWAKDRLLEAFPGAEEVEGP